MQRCNVDVSKSIYSIVQQRQPRNVNKSNYQKECQEKKIASSFECQVALRLAIRRMQWQRRSQVRIYRNMPDEKNCGGLTCLKVRRNNRHSGQTTWQLHDTIPEPSLATFYTTEYKQRQKFPFNGVGIHNHLEKCHKMLCPLQNILKKNWWANISAPLMIDDYVVSQTPWFTIYDQLSWIGRDRNQQWAFETRTPFSLTIGQSRHYQSFLHC